MKKLILILITFVFIGCKSSDPCQEKIKDYKSLESFKNDTLLFLQKSILNRKQHYIDKNLNQLLKDINFPITKYSYRNKHSNKSISTGLNLKIAETSNKRNSLKNSSINISVTWKVPLNKSIVDSLFKKSNANWISSVDEFYSKKIISDFNINNDSYSLKNIECNPEKKYNSFQPLKKFKGDTLAFIQNSILKRLEFYENKEIKFLIKDLSIPIEKYYPFFMVNGGDANLTGNALQLKISYLLEENSDRKLISIVYDGQDPNKSHKTNVWTNEVYKKYKDKKIKKIILYDLIDFAKTN